MHSIHIIPERGSILLTVIKEFKGLAAESLSIVAESCQWHRYEEGEDIVRYHDSTHSVFFIIQGEIRIKYYALSGNEVILCDLPRGEMFGELSAIDDRARSATAVAKSTAMLASMPATTFQDLLYESEQIAEAILKRLTGQVRRLTERVYEFSSMTLNNRIHAELLRLAKNHMISPNEAFISPVVRSDIANLVSTTRESVSREFSNLTEHKIIECQGRHKVHVLDVAKLAKMVSEVRGSF
ncbi:Crp/Fnr family transcriptional regulator [uncultured Nitrosomonas sp.]|uniref:Crp/Fnr family transcriptional regulator n=1 Tax=uncultured Nitrosomonas sp. TaxID=156424 RepID=UPI0025EDCD2D|nr:Crp/Fnr family transcriptional regulator [uncultured Nitrosomonas sp.]